MTKSVLLVDDEPAIRRVLTRFLSNSGYEVHEAATTEAAVNIFMCERPMDILLCDLFLGAGGNGWDVVTRLYTFQPSIKVVIMTGHSALTDPGMPLSYRVLHKPFTPDELEKTLNSIWH